MTLRKTITQEKHNSGRGNENFPQWLNEKEVSAITGIAVQTLRNHRHNRKGIPYSKLSSRSVKYLLSDVTDFMLSHRIQTEAK